MAFRSAGTATSATTASTTITPGSPAGFVANDILIIVVSGDATGNTYTWPSGFTQLYLNSLASPDGQTIGVAWKRAAGGDALTVTRATTGPSWVAQCFAWSGRDTTNPPVGSTAATSTASNASPTTVTANTVTALASDDLVWIGVLDVTVATASTTFTQPTGYTTIATTIDTIDHFDVFGVASKDAVSAGATGSVAGVLTHSGGAGWAAYLIRIPAAGGASAFDIPQLGMMGVGF